LAAADYPLRLPLFGVVFIIAAIAMGIKTTPTLVSTMKSYPIMNVAASNSSPGVDSQPGN